jgi:RNA polymerase sigma-70 factor (ECF subfamily)
MSDAERDLLGPTSAPMPLSTDELRLVEMLRHGDEAAFVTLVERYQQGLVRLSLVFAPSRTAAEQAVQETWLDVLQDALRFEMRASLKLWIFGLLVERLAARGEYVPFALETDAAPSAPAIQPERFLPPDHPKWPGHWAAFPQTWANVPESRLRGPEMCERLEATIEALSPQQRAVISLRDVEHWMAEEVELVLGIGAAQQCALLHQARSVVRGVLETCLDKE